MARFETRDADWLSLQEACARIRAVATPLAVHRVPLLHALGFALAQDVVSDVDLPPWDNSAVDGYAVRGEDVRGATPERPRTLRVVGSVPSGVVDPPQIGVAEAVRIMTGAPVPASADSVIRVEDTDREKRAGEVRVFSDRDVAWNVRPGGQDMRRGDLLLTPGAALGPGQLSLISALGWTEVNVYRRPSVGIITSGDELAGPEEQHRVRRGQAIPDTNRTLLQAAVLAAGGTPHFLGLARDTRESVRETVLAGRHLDALVTVGGASMGEADLFKRVLEDLGFQLDFWRVMMRPGTPFSFGHLPREGGAGALPVFGLPGNPASAVVTFEVLVRPFLLRLGGHSRTGRLTLRAKSQDTLESRSRFAHFFRVRLRCREGVWYARLSGPQGSGLVRSLGFADGLALVPEDRERIERGEFVDVLVIRDAPGFVQETDIDPDEP